MRTIHIAKHHHANISTLTLMHEIRIMVYADERGRARLQGLHPGSPPRVSTQGLARTLGLWLFHTVLYQQQRSNERLRIRDCSHPK